MSKLDATQVPSERLNVKALARDRFGPFTLAANAGTCVVITGKSGTGKSLLLRMIADLAPHEGEAWLDGTPVRP